MKNRLLAHLLAAILFALSLPCVAEDVDLFFNTAPKDSEIPNVLIVVDNTANWNQAFANEMAALSNTLRDLPAGSFRVGFLFAAETGSPNNNTDGGYVRAAIRLLNTDTKLKYQNLVQSFDKLADKGNGGSASLVMAEAYRYLTGGTPYAGNGKVKTDYAGNVSGTAASNAVYALPGNALNSKDGTKYVSPITSSCQKNFIIYVSNGPSQDNNTVKTKSESMLTEAGGDKTAIKISPSGSQSNPIDEWARFLKKSSLGVVTYTIDVNPGSTGQGPGWTAVLKSMATVSSGKYFSVSDSAGGGQITEALQRIFSEIQAVNSVFASVSLPVSVNTQGTYLNQVFIGMFRPDADAFPRWNGNLKQYKMGYDNGVLKLLDATDSSAINNQTGFITECARSYWTPDSSNMDEYWAFRPQGGCLAVAQSDKSNTPDGNIVEKGAQAYVLRKAASRTIKTCTPGSCTDLTAFNSTNVTQSMLGAASTAESDALISWAKGADVDDENNNANVTEMRPSSHGDIVHSRPVAINFGTDSSPQVVVFYGGNDGMLRAVNGNRTGSIMSHEAGGEMWAFMPPEFYKNIKRLRDNTVQIDYKGPNAVYTSPRLPKPYGVDGVVTAYKDTSNTWIFAGLRRGGRAFYAFDVTAPASPSLKWRQGCPNQDDDSGCSDGFTGIGQTWSSLKPLKSSGYGAGTKPMVIAGGGYDKCEDGDPNTCTSATKGNKIYVLDADTGKLLRTMDTERGVVADIFVIEDPAGLAKFAYAADMGGNIYRITIGASAPDDWVITKIASLGCDTVASCTANRKFIYPPDVVDDNGTYVLLIGSGDREKPTTSYTSAAGVRNHFFMIKDKPADSDWLTSETVNCGGAAVICKNSLLALPAANVPVSGTELVSKKGWYLELRSSEQVVTSAITVFGVVTFSTHQSSVPTAGTCSANLGTARVYNLDYATGAGSKQRSEDIAGGGLPPSPIAGKVTLDDGKTTVPFIIGSKPDSPLEGGEPPVPGVSSQPKSRVFWYIRQ